MWKQLHTNDSLTKPLTAPAHFTQGCALALALKQKQIEGMMFLSNGVMDVGFESVDWTGEWIQKIGDTRS